MVNVLVCFGLFLCAISDLVLCSQCHPWLSLIQKEKSISHKKELPITLAIQQSLVSSC